MVIGNLTGLEKQAIIRLVSRFIVGSTHKQASGLSRGILVLSRAIYKRIKVKEIMLCLE